MVVFALQNNSLDHIGRLVVPCVEYCRSRGLDFVDRSLTSDLDVDSLPIDDTGGLIVYGSVGWTKRFKNSRFGEWVDHDQETFAASLWGPLLGERAFNGRGRLMGVGEVSAELEAGKSLHVRPDHEDKAFPGAAFDAKSWGDTIHRRRREYGKGIDDVVCWASDIRPIDEEIRCWVLGGRLVDASRYRRGGALEIERISDRGVLGLAAELVELYAPGRDFVMDMALSQGEGYVLEYNPIHSSGWYGADIGSILGEWVSLTEERALVRSSPATSGPCLR